MGSSTVGLADDLPTIFWNPAGISEAQNLSALTGYSFFKTGFNLIHIILVQPLGETSGFGASYIRTSTDDIPLYDSAGNQTGNFTANQNIIYASYSFALLGFPLIKTIQIGLNVKYLIFNLYQNKASGLSFDIGL